MPVETESPTMRAWMCRAYGPPERLTLESVARPVPRAGEVRVRIRATTVSSGDWRIRGLDLPRGFGAFGRLAFGLLRPRRPVLGSEFSGVVDAVAADVTAFAPGDAVVGFPGLAMGCHAEYRTMRADAALVDKPGNLSFEEAASLCFGGTTALHFLRRAGLLAGERILVLGAAGAVGSAMVQLARQRGAVVTAVTGAANLDLVRSLVAAETVDRESTDFYELGARFDVVADTVGASDFARCAKLLDEGGRYLAIAADLKGMFAHRIGTKRSIAGPASERVADVAELARLAEAGTFRPVVGGVFPFDRLPEAHVLAASGRKRGSAVVQVSADG
jgi:NADPH:quinone reductase-like Zn-dependent oxidoreductase